MLSRIFLGGPLVPAQSAILADNAAQFRRLQATVARLGTDDRDLDGGWGKSGH
jgi:hypothetical protein